MESLIIISYVLQRSPETEAQMKGGAITHQMIAQASRNGKT